MAEARSQVGPGCAGPKGSGANASRLRLSRCSPGRWARSTCDPASWQRPSAGADARRHEKLRVQTTEPREFDVTRLKIGMPVELTFDALPRPSGPRAKIARIAPMSTTEKGSTNFTVIVEMPDLDPSLRWGMTAFVNIQAGK